MKQKNTQWFAIVIAIWIILIITLIAFYILEFIIPFAKNVKGLENSAMAYYQAYYWVEESIYDIRTNGIGYESTLAFSGTPLTYSYDIDTLNTRHPAVWEWDSEYDSNWGTLAQWKPLQIYLPNNLAPVISSIRVYFRVPNFDSNTTTSESFDDSSLSDLDIVNWQIAGPTDVLNSRPVSIYPNNRIRSWNICSSTAVSCTWYQLSNKIWFTLEWTVDQDITTFYNANCRTSNYDCILKLTVINDLVATSWTVSGKKIPYLEYYIDFSWVNVPNPKILIDTSGKSYGYRKDIRINLPQKWLIEAFDFTVFQ